MVKLNVTKLVFCEWVETQQQTNGDVITVDGHAEANVGQQCRKGPDRLVLGQLTK